jgi:serine/threonine-protein kinase
LAAPLQIGRYVLHGEIASGGMAAVHYGRLVGASGFTKTVAIKRLHRALAQQPGFRKMILEEGRLAARIRHPNVVPPLDVLAEGGELLLVMEYVHGESLSRLLRASSTGGERVPLPVGAAILSNVLHGLHAAHEAKDEAGKPLAIVHRDISPQNILVGVDGVARVIDFGIAKAVTSEEMTMTGTIKGKVPYLAPEQLEGEAATKLTDVYAAAVVFWEVLAGRRLFSGDDDGEVLRKIMSMEVPPPSLHNPLVAGTVDDVVLKGIARDPKNRFASARDMALALEEAVHLATATVVGAWTERLAAKTLAERAERIREVEGTGSLPDVTGTPAGTVRLDAGAASSAGAAVAPSRSQRPPPPLPAAATSPTSSASASPSTVPPPKRANAAPPPVPKPPSPSLPSAAPSPPAHTQAMPAIPAPPAKGAPRLTIPPSSRQPQPSGSPPPEPPMGAPPPSSRASAPPTRPKAASRPLMEPRTVIYEPPPMPEPDFIEGVRPISPNAPPPMMAPPYGSVAPLAPPPAGALRKPDVLIPNVAWLPPPPAKPRATAGAMFKRFLRYLAAFLVLALIVAWMFAPAIARAWIVTGAAKEGIVVTIDRVDVSRKAIRLSDLHAESAEFPGASLRAGTLSINLRWLVPDSISLDDAELGFDGSYSTVAGRIEQFRAKHGIQLATTLPGIRKVEVTSGRVDWKNPLGAGTSALVENITFDITKNPVRAFGDDYNFTAPLFTMKLAGAPAGPWQLDVRRQGILVHSELNFDPSGSSQAKITHTAGDDGSVTLSFAIPSTQLKDLHIPAAVLGAVGTPRTRVDAKGEVTIVAVQQTTTRAGDASAPASASATASAAPPASAASPDGGAAKTPPAASTSRMVSGHLGFVVTGLVVFPAGPQLDVSLDLPLPPQPGGDAAVPIPVTGVLGFAAADPAGGASKPAASAPVTGTLDLTRAIAHLELGGKTGAIPCARPAPPPGTPAAPPSPKDGTTGIVATVAVTLDDLPGARVSFQPVSACTPRLR